MSKPFDPSNPLTQADYRKLKEAIAVATQGCQACERAESAGIRVDEERERLEYTRDQLMRIKTTYFPDQP